MTEVMRPSMQTSRASPSTISLQLVHVGQEFGVVADLFQAADQQFHCFYRRKRVEHAAKDEDALQVFLGDEQLFLGNTSVPLR